MARDTLQFLLDGERITLRDVPPTRTVLEYLREDLVRTGTKEGCAEGDCGACMVVIADLHADGVRYQPINACIQFLATLDGKALITVESLAANGALHPAQRAMIDCHGSQCGFCTPGFVMTLFALHTAHDQSPGRVAIDDALAGNLCRCTGYRPIIAAAEHMFESGSDATGERAADTPWTPPWGSDAELAEALRAIAPDTTLVTGNAGQRLVAPESIDALADAYAAEPSATLLAGGTDVGLWVTKQYRDLGTVIALADVPELKVLTTEGDDLVVGAAVTFSELMPVVLAHYPELTALFRRWASPPIRNAATIGGNIANGSPIGDSMPPLVALGATVTLRRADATRTLALEDLYLDYMRNVLADGEFVQSIQIPARVDGQRVAGYKLSKRFDQDISAVCAGISLVINDDIVQHARIAFGGMAGTVRRASACEAALTGQPLSDETLASAQGALDQDFDPLTDLRATASYRRTAARNLLHRCFVAFTGTEETDVYDFAR